MAQGQGNADQTDPAPKLKPRSEAFKELQARMEQSILEQTNTAPMPAPKPKPRTKAVDQCDILQHVLNPVYQDQPKIPPPPLTKPKSSPRPDDQIQPVVLNPVYQDQPKIPPPPLTKPKSSPRPDDQIQPVVLDPVYQDQLKIPPPPPTRPKSSLNPDDQIQPDGLNPVYQDQPKIPPPPLTKPKSSPRPDDQIQPVVLDPVYQDQLKIPPPPPTRPKSSLNPDDQIQPDVLDPVYQDQLRIPPPTPTKPKSSLKQDNQIEHVVLDPDSLNEWWNTVSPWGHLLEELKDKNENEIITIEADRIYKAVQLFHLLMTVNTTTLSNLINQLNLIADNLDKVSNKTKAAGIGGGATMVLGGLAAGAGILFAPVTLGASLAITAVGVGVAAAGGVTGASAAIANKVNLEKDKKNISKVFQDYNDIMQNIQCCLMFIMDGVNQLAQQALLSKVNTVHVRLLRVVQLESTCPKAIKANSEAYGIMRGIAMGLDMYFKGEKGEKIKKLSSKLAMKLRVVAQELTVGLGEYVKANEDLSEFRPVG